MPNFVNGSAARPRSVRARGFTADVALPRLERLYENVVASEPA